MKWNCCIHLVATLQALARFFTRLWEALRCRLRPSSAPLDVELVSERERLVKHTKRAAFPGTRPRSRLTLSSSASSLEEIVVCAGLGESVGPQPMACAPGQGRGYYGVHYQRYAIRSYMDLPCVLQPFASLPGVGSFLVVARPTMDASGGLAGYGQVVPRGELQRSPFVVVVDRPGMPCPDDQYYWVEFPLPDVFKLDVSGLASFDDYVHGHLRRKHRRAFRVRQQELAGSPLVMEYVPLRRGQRQLVEAMWRLYLMNGQRHGFHVTCERDFFRIHLSGTPGLSVLLVKDASQGGQIVTFVTAIRSEDTLMSMWCGTDYDNPLSRACSTYINSQYELIRIAIQDPGVRWLDLGAQLRQMKTNIGCRGYPVSGYMRCSNKLMRAMAQRMMQDCFDPSRLLEDA